MRLRIFICLMVACLVFITAGIYFVDPITEQEILFFDKIQTAAIILLFGYILSKELDQ